MLQNCFIVFSGLFICTLFTLDLATWIVGINMHQQTHTTACFAVLCLDKWLIVCGLVSMYLNFYRLWDLAHLYAAMDEPTSSVGPKHFACRIGIEVVIAAFHLISAAVGVLLILDLQITSHEQERQYGVNTAHMTWFMSAIIAGHVCYILISVYIARLKYVHFWQKKYDG